jgi:hypothetical protein
VLSSISPSIHLCFLRLWDQISFSLLLTAPFRYSYYTAGSGGAGPTILATSFLLLGEEAIVYQDGTASVLLVSKLICIWVDPACHIVDLESHYAI